jgi:hypothetical protein
MDGAEMDEIVRQIGRRREASSSASRGAILHDTGKNGGALSLLHRRGGPTSRKGGLVYVIRL